MLGTAMSLVLSDESGKNITEAINYCEKVIEECSNEKIRSMTRAALCFLYNKNAENEKAIGYARTLPHIWESREMLLCEFACEEEYTNTVKKVTELALSMIYEKIKNIQPASFHKNINRLTIGHEITFNKENIGEILETVSEFYKGN